MPSYATSAYTPSEQHAPYIQQQKYDGTFETRGAFNGLHSASASESDFDPYNHNKHAGFAPSAYASYMPYYAEPQNIDSRGRGLVGQPGVQQSQFNSISQSRGYDASADALQRFEPPPGFKGPPAQDDKVVGGVSAQLDYEMEQMTDFVVEMAVTLIQTASYDRVLFRKWVLQVLNATRLPSATILLSLSYLVMRINGLKARNKFVPTERGLYQFLTVALILGSKFLDDNTFQNKSWAEVSNIPVKDLNRDEMDWLEAFGHRLHFDPDIPDGFSHWQGRWASFKARVVLPMPSLLSIDTAVRRPRSSRPHDTSPAFARQFSASALSAVNFEPISAATYTPSYSPYDSWYGRSGPNRSPSTAGHTGPNTPDYYAPTNRWGLAGQTALAREARLGYSSLPQLTTDLGVYQPAYDSAVYGYNTPSVWGMHGNACQCSSCRHSHHHLQPRFGPLTAA